MMGKNGREGERMDRRLRAVGLALLAAVLYAVNLPFSKLLLGQVGSLTLAGLLYLGAGAGMALLSLFHRDDAPRLGREDLAPTLGMILLDIAAPILLMLGLRGGEAASASLLGNFEIVATALFALLLFRERVSRTLWAALGCITLSCGVLSFQGAESLRFSAASLLVLGAACCWGLENNCTRRLSSKSAREIVILKGFFSGRGSLCLARLAGESLPPLGVALRAMGLGFVSYGLSIFFYVRAQRAGAGGRPHQRLLLRESLRGVPFGAAFATGGAGAGILRRPAGDASGRGPCHCGHPGPGAGDVPSRGRGRGLSPGPPWRPWVFPRFPGLTKLPGIRSGILPESML